jgi:hypothetical protein
MDFDVAPPIRQALLGAIDPGTSATSWPTPPVTNACADFFSTAYSECPDGSSGGRRCYQHRQRSLFVPAGAGHRAHRPIPRCSRSSSRGRPVVQVRSSAASTTSRPTWHAPRRPSTSADQRLRCRGRAPLLPARTTRPGRSSPSTKLCVGRHPSATAHGSSPTGCAPSVHPGPATSPRSRVRWPPGTLAVTSVSKAWNLAGLRSAPGRHDEPRGSSLANAPVFAVHGHPARHRHLAAAYVDDRPCSTAWSAPRRNRRRLGELLQAGCPAMSLPGARDLLARGSTAPRSAPGPGRLLPPRGRGASAAGPFRAGPSTCGSTSPRLVRCSSRSSLGHGQRHAPDLNREHQTGCPWLRWCRWWAWSSCWTRRHRLTDGTPPRPIEQRVGLLGATGNS